MQSKIKYFDTSIIKGLKQAEKHKENMCNLYDTVTVTPHGLNGVAIIGYDEL